MARSSGMKGGSRPGGGPASRVVKEVGVRTGQKPTGVNPAAVSQIGSSLGNHVTDGRTKLAYRGEPYREKTPISVPLGNAIATNIGKGGPGTGRTVMVSGSQCQTGPVNPGSPAPGASKPIFPGFK
jgi:hypothetical protein